MIQGDQSWVAVQMKRHSGPVSDNRDEAKAYIDAPIEKAIRVPVSYTIATSAVGATEVVFRKNVDSTRLNQGDAHRPVLPGLRYGVTPSVCLIAIATSLLGRFDATGCSAGGQGECTDDFGRPWRFWPSPNAETCKTLSGTRA